MKLFGIISLVLSLILYWMVSDQGKDLSVGSMKVEPIHCGILFFIAIVFLIWGLARETKCKYPKYS